MSEGWLMTHRAMLAVGARGLNRGITRAIHAAIARTEFATLIFVHGAIACAVQTVAGHWERHGNAS